MIIFSSGFERAVRRGEKSVYEKRHSSLFSRAREREDLIQADQSQGDERVEAPTWR